MTSKRFDVLTSPVYGMWTPAILTLNTTSARSDTLGVTIDNARGSTGILFQGESYREAMVPAGLPPPLGYKVVSFSLDRLGGGLVYMVATVAAEELLQTAREFRRGKPKTPIPKGSNDEVHECVSCHMRVMSRGADREGWKGLQMQPTSMTIDYYCNKAVCIEKRDEAIEVAKVNWGLTTPVSTEPEPVKNEEKKAEGYGPPPEKPFL